jgi:hypothetical protein
MIFGGKGKGNLQKSQTKLVFSNGLAFVQDFAWILTHDLNNHIFRNIKILNARR